MPKVKKKQIVLLLIVILGLYAITYILPSIISKVTPTVTIEYGNLKIEDEVTCYALRDETVYIADSAGDVKYKAKEGDQLKVGSKVIDFQEVISEGEETVYSGAMAANVSKDGVATNSSTAKRKGVFSTYIDGYEGYFALKNFNKLTEDKAQSKDQKVTDIKESSVDKKQPMYKITDQSRWYLTCWIDGKDISKYEVGKRISVKFEDAEIKFDIERIEKEGSKWKMLLSSNRYYEKFTQFRKAEVKLIAMDINGILIPNDSITTKDDKVGVYVLSKTGDKTFVPISQMGTNGEMTVVREESFYDKDGNLVNTVKGFDEILKNPGKGD